MKVKYVVVDELPSGWELRVDESMKLFEEMKELVELNETGRV